MASVSIHSTATRHFPVRRLSNALPRATPSVGVPSPPSVRFFTPCAGYWRISKLSAMQEPRAVSSEEMPLEIDGTTVEDYAAQAKLLKEFTNIPGIDKAWTFKSDNENSSRAMFSIGQMNLLANKKRAVILSTHILKSSKNSIDFQWSPFPIEMIGVSAVVPSPSGSRLLVVRNKENEISTQLEIWGSSQLEKEILVPKSVHGPLFTDGWFEGISWDEEENLIAYIAEGPSPVKPAFNDSGYMSEGASEKDFGSWKGQGDWEEDWGETYSKKRKPSLFVVNIDSSEVRAVDGIAESLSVGQVIWAPSSPTNHHKYLVFVAWSSENGPNRTARKLGIKYCYNRPCALYAVTSPFQASDAHELPSKNEMEDCNSAVNLTHGLSSAFFPRFSPDGKFLVFLSAKSAVESGAHSATNSLHRMDWPINRKPHPTTNILDVVPVVMCPEDSCFPGLYCSNFLYQPWLSDGYTMILTSVWGSTEVILSVNILSCEISRITPSNSDYSWNALALDGDNILAVSSSPLDPPQIKYGDVVHTEQKSTWEWMDVKSPLAVHFEKVKTLLSSYKFNILKIPVCGPCEDLSKGAKKPFEAIFIADDSQKDGASNPLILLLHGGPHSVSVSSFSKSVAFLSSLGYNMLIVNYRGSLGFGEEALQSLPGKIGDQDVDDVLAALDYVIEKGLADTSKVAVLGGSHGGFLTTHLIGQAPDRFVVAAVRNPVCNLSLMVGTTDIPDWCYVEAYGREGRNFFSEAPSIDHLSLFYNKSPISHLEKVKAPTLFLLGAQDLRVPVSNGLQYARALREKGVEVKVIVFPDDVHGIERDLQLEYLDLYLVHWPISLKPTETKFPIKMKVGLLIDIKLEGRPLLRDLQLEYVDLYLVHWPVSLKPTDGDKSPIDLEGALPIDITSLWKAMGECHRLGLAKSIGVSNFSCKKLDQVLKIAKIPPAVNMVEMHPLWQQKRLIDFCKEKSIQLTAYSPLGGNGTPWGFNNVIDCTVLKEIATARGKTVAQVSLRWIYQQGAAPVVKSFKPERRKENKDIFDWELSEEELSMISRIPQCKGVTGAGFASADGPSKSLQELWDGKM